MTIQIFSFVNDVKCTGNAVYRSTCAVSSPLKSKKPGCGYRMTMIEGSSATTNLSHERSKGEFSGDDGNDRCARIEIVQEDRDDGNMGN